MAFIFFHVIKVNIDKRGGRIKNKNKGCQPQVSTTTPAMLREIIFDNEQNE